MAKFLSHTSCPRCGSKDNLGIYDDGSAWCFGCHFYQASHHVPSFHAEKEEGEIKLPEDISITFPQHVVEWLAEYDIKIEEARKWGWLYSPYWDQLVFPFYGEETELCMWQGRNFREGARKYYNQGTPADLLPIFRGPPALGGCDERCRQLVVVEDAVSAAKIARQSDAMPCLGSHLPARKIMRLKPFYEFLVVWLDADKLKEARHIAELAKWIGFRTKVVHTPLDPKEYNDTQIKEYLK